MVDVVRRSNIGRDGGDGAEAAVPATGAALVEAVDDVLRGAACNA